MSKELAFALINPYTIAKSRTGGVIGRFISRTELDLVAARMFAPSPELVREYARLVRHADPEHQDMCELIADYILSAYGPDRTTGLRRRVMLLLFEGENAVAKIWGACGSAKSQWGSGETIRDTYGDYIIDERGGIRYFEPAVLVGPSRERAARTLRLWAAYSAADGGLITAAVDVPTDENVEQTLVLLKPDNFRFHSSRPGMVVDILSRSGLRIVGAKKFRMTVAQAERFYEPVRRELRQRLRDRVAARAATALSREFQVNVPDEMRDALAPQLAGLVADLEFERIIEFMTGFRPSECPPDRKAATAREECLALVYRGPDAVRRIRELLGTTDPSKAAPGSVRREYGRDILVNAAHASDCAESAAREIELVDVQEDTVSRWVQEYYGS